MFFFKQSGVKAEDVIAVLSVMYHAEQHPAEWISNQVKILEIISDGLTGFLPELLRDLEEKDPDFPSKFVEYATGSPYLPHLESNPDFKITIEFNSEDQDIKDPNSLPVAHSCINLVKFPATAYEGSKETLKEKLIYSLKNFENCTFDSA